jgi:DNA-directed RNA polymerase specialized sigma24 family protein
VRNRLIWTFLGPDSECDDIAHDIFVKILRSASSVKQTDRLEDWAARVTMNTIKNEFRRRKLRRFVSLHATTESNTPRCHVDFEGRELLMRTQALARAPPDHGAHPVDAATAPASERGRDSAPLRLLHTHRETSSQVGQSALLETGAERADDFGAPRPLGGGAQ